MDGNIKLDIEDRMGQHLVEERDRLWAIVSMIQNLQVP
jgi:hypothetical protein